MKQAHNTFGNETKTQHKERVGAISLARHSHTHKKNYPELRRNTCIPNTIFMCLSEGHKIAKNRPVIGLLLHNLYSQSDQYIYV